MSRLFTFVVFFLFLLVLGQSAYVWQSDVHALPNGAVVECRKNPPNNELVVVSPCANCQIGNVVVIDTPNVALLNQCEGFAWKIDSGPTPEGSNDVYVVTLVVGLADVFVSVDVSGTASLNDGNAVANDQTNNLRMRTQAGIARQTVTFRLNFVAPNTLNEFSISISANASIHVNIDVNITNHQTGEDHLVGPSYFKIAGVPYKVDTMFRAISDSNTSTALPINLRATGTLNDLVTVASSESSRNSWNPAIFKWLFAWKLMIGRICFDWRFFYGFWFDIRWRIQGPGDCWTYVKRYHDTFSLHFRLPHPSCSCIKTDVEYLRTRKRFWHVKCLKIWRNDNPPRVLVIKSIKKIVEKNTCVDLPFDLFFWKKCCGGRGGCDPEFRTMDGLQYEYSGPCSYIASTNQCANQKEQKYPKFQVISHHGRALSRQKNIHVIGAVTVNFWLTKSTLNAEQIEFKSMKTIMVNNKKAKVPYEDNTILIVKRDTNVNGERASYLYFKTNFGLEMRWSNTGSGLFELIVPSNEQICGLLGNNNGKIEDDLELRNGTQLKFNNNLIASSSSPSKIAPPKKLVTMMGDSWFVPTPNQPLRCELYPKHSLQSQNFCLLNKDKVVHACENLLKNQFEVLEGETVIKCFPKESDSFIDQTRVYDDCVTEICACKKDKIEECVPQVAINEFKQACVDNGVYFPPINWKEFYLYQFPSLDHTNIID